MSLLVEDYYAEKLDKYSVIMHNPYSNKNYSCIFILY